MKEQTEEKPTARQYLEGKVAGRKEYNIDNSICPGKEGYSFFKEGIFYDDKREGFVFARDFDKGLEQNLALAEEDKHKEIKDKRAYFVSEDKLKPLKSKRNSHHYSLFYGPGVHEINKNLIEDIYVWLFGGAYLKLSKENGVNYSIEMGFSKRKARFGAVFVSQHDYGAGSLIKSLWISSEDQIRGGKK